MLKGEFSFKLPEISRNVPLDEISSIKQGSRGVYVIKNEFGDCLYVGQSINLRSRLLTHVRSSPFSVYIDRVDIYEIKEGLPRELTETIFINEMAPRYNRSKVFIPYSLEEETAYEEAEVMELERNSLRDELSELKEWLGRGYGDGYMDDVFEYFTDEDEMNSTILGEDLHSIMRIEEIKTEISALSHKINEKYILFSPT